LEGVTISNHLLLRVSQLSFKRGESWLFTALSFDVYSSQIIWLRGQNGRGKTSLLRILVGLAQPDGGDLVWENSIAPNQGGAYLSQKIVYIGHTNGLKDELTAFESLQFLTKINGQLASTEMINMALRRLGVEHCGSTLVRNLSQGQRRRVALARLAVDTGASLWVLDEPFDTLDTDGVDVVNSLLAEHLVRQGSVVLTSHISVNGLDASVKQINLDETSR
jgi:heme exporter protein A